MMISHPPTISNYVVKHSTRLRFTAGAAIDQAITFADLLDTLLVAKTAVAGSDLFQSVKVRGVEVWASPVLGTATTVIVGFLGATSGEVGDQSVHTDTSMGIQPAHVLARPTLRSLASNFQLASAGEAFYLNCPTGSVVDVELTFNGAFAASVAAQNALVGATAGATYLRGLDGLAVAASKLLPISSDWSI